MKPLDSRPGCLGAIQGGTLCPFVWVLAVWLAVPAGLRAADVPDEAALDALVQSALKAWQVPGAVVAIVRDDQVGYLKGHGVRAIDGTDPVTADTLFPLGSCSKGFTSTALALLVGEGKVGWDDPVRKHLPWFHLADPLADQNVTLRDLLCHRTGLSGHTLLWYKAPWTPEEAVRRAGLLPLDRPFRSSFRYQSTMVSAAGLAAGAAAGTSWEDLVQTRLFKPLGMTSSVCTTPAAEKFTDRAFGHWGGPGGLESMPPFRMKVADPAGSVSSSARDLARWLRFQLAGGRVGDRQLVDAHALAETHTAQIPIERVGADQKLFPETVQLSYGLCWVVLDYRGQPLVAHAGVIDGFSTQLTMVPRHHLGVVVLANRHDTRFNLALSNSLVDALLGLPRLDWNARLAAVIRQAGVEAEKEARARQAEQQRGTSPSLEAGAYVGVFEHPAYGTASIVRGPRGLEWHFREYRVPLEHFHYDTFLIRVQDWPEPARLSFRLGPDGTVVAMRFTSGPGVEFVRVRR